MHLKPGTPDHRVLRAAFKNIAHEVPSFDSSFDPTQAEACFLEILHVERMPRFA